MEYVKSDAPRQRFLAAIALGTIGRSDAQSSLAPLLQDEDARVRLAAATAILQLKPPTASAAISSP
jgi:HEAT repeat protein